MLILKLKKTFILNFVAVVILTYLSTAQYAHADTIDSEISNIRLPDNFSIRIYSKLAPQYGLPRMMTFDRDGKLYVALASSNRVIMISDENGDGLADKPVVIADHLNAPNSIAFVDDKMFISNQDGIVKLTRQAGAWSTPVPFISNLPTGGHTLKTIRAGADQHLYLNIGSSCNVCEEQEAKRATIMRYTLDGRPAGFLTTVGRHTPSAIWAKGLRNSQGFAWHPVTGDFFATNDGADNRSGTKNGRVNDELPPEHLNIIKEGYHYGWPFCWANPNEPNMMFQDPNFVGSSNFCEKTTPPAITFKAHSTPIGITFLDKSQFPDTYKSDAIVALHGSWNRKEPSGYKLVRVKFKDNQPVEVLDFATGWLKGKSAWGRPVDVTVGPNGALYVSDDHAGLIYVIEYQPKS